MTDTWSITERGFEVRTAKAWEGLFTQGSGYLQVRGSLEEHLADCPQNTEYMRFPGNVTLQKFPDTKCKWGTYVPGIYGPHPLCNNEMLNLPFFLDLRPVADGEKLDLEHSRVSGCRRSLNLRDAVLTRDLVWRTRDGARIRVRFERFVSASRPSLCCQRLQLTASRAMEMRIYAGIDADVRTNGYDHFAEIEIGQPAADEVHCRVVTDGGDTVEIRSVWRGPFIKTGFQHGDRDGRLAGTLQLRRHQPAVIEKRTAVATSRDLEPQTPAAMLAAAAGRSWDELHAEHAAIWERRWSACDVVVEGDERSQLALRASLYHLLRAHVPDARVAIDAKGYAGEAYWGRFFWDTEMNLLPFYLYTMPDKARTLVDFRVQSLPGARGVAAGYGYAGAKYAWESDSDGNECCPGWQYRDHEIHVTADVVYGLAHFAAAADREYLRGPAAAVLLETGRYWLDRIDWRPGDNHASLVGVMGPDEYTPISHNNAYTNRLAAFALALAAAGRRGSRAEKKRFREAAEALPVFQDEQGLVMQSEEFVLYGDTGFDRHWRRREEMYGTQVPQERLYRTQCLKQADVILLMMLFPHEYRPDQVRLAWDYYVPRTTHDSSLSAGVHAVVAARLGLDHEAWEFWRRSADKDLDVAHGGAADGIHIAGCGNNWQVAVFGFGGMRTALQAPVLTLEPRLPKAWRKLEFPVIWQGAAVKVSISKEDCRVRNRSREEITVSVWGQERKLSPGRISCWRRPR